MISRNNTASISYSIHSESISTKHNSINSKSKLITTLPRILQIFFNRLNQASANSIASMQRLGSMLCIHIWIYFTENLYFNIISRITSSIIIRATFSHVTRANLHWKWNTQTSNTRTTHSHISTSIYPHVKYYMYNGCYWSTMLFNQRSLDFFFRQPYHILSKIKQTRMETPSRFSQLIALPFAPSWFPWWHYIPVIRHKIVVTRVLGALATHNIHLPCVWKQPALIARRYV